VIRALLLGLAVGLASMAQAAGLADIAGNLELRPPGAGAQVLDLPQAMQALRVPSVSVAVIRDDRIAWAEARGEATARTIYQAASMSKLVAAVAALCLVQQQRLGLDRDVNTELTAWHLPASPLARGRPVTLRGLLSMTGGIDVPGYPGYRPGAALPDLVQILDGAPPANSPPVRIEHAPGTAYAYSGGGYEIVQALVAAAARQDFADAVKRLVLGPVQMTHSFYGAPPRPGEVAAGHLANGAELDGGWRAMPELAAGGLWSTPTDLAKLLIAITRAYRGLDHRPLDAATVQQMLQRQNGGHYGLGGAIDGTGQSLVLMKRGQNIGYQGYLLLFPALGQGMVVMANSDNGTTLATALIRRATRLFGWPTPDELPD
jgi:CubicO group peptidase (beta-lactamase class C family)